MPTFIRACFIEHPSIMSTVDRDKTVAKVYEFVSEHALIFLALLLLLIPWLTGNYSLSTHILIFALFAMGYNLSLGDTGMLTFGHAAFFGLGAYGAGLFLAHLDIPRWLGFFGLVTGVLLATVGGLTIGALSVRRRGTYLALITLAFQQMIYFIAFQWESLTGGDNGLFGIATPTIGVPGVFLLQFTDALGGLITGRQLFYWFVLLLFVFALLALRFIKQSNFGHTLNAIRENEDRARFLGYNVYRYRLIAFTVSAAFSGLAGALYPMYYNYVGISTLDWVLSGKVNFFVLLGGIGTFLGPAIGALSYFWLVDTLSTVTEHYQLLMGIILIAVVLFLPEGILGTAKEYIEVHTGVASDKPRQFTDDQSGTTDSVTSSSSRGDN